MKINDSNSMTNKEKIIYHILLENPMLSQEEIAYKANMSRSSVSVHISNMMTKGIILGRSYVVQDTGYIVILGEIIVEINGKTVEESNKEKIEIGVRGSGITTSSRFNKENIESYLITAIPNSFFGTLVQNWCNGLGIDLKHSYFSKSDYNNLSMTLSKNGQRQEVIHDNMAMDTLPLNHLLNQDKLLRNSNLILIASNFNLKASEYAIERYSDKQIMLSIYDNFEKHRILSLIEKVSIIHCSLSLLEIKNDDEINVFKEMKKMLSEKTSLVCVNDSKRLFILSHDYKEMINFDIDDMNEKDVFDQITSGIAMSSLQKYDYEQMFELALKNIRY